MIKLLYIIPLVFILSCSTKEAPQSENDVQESPVDKESIPFSKEQIKLAGIQTGKLKKRAISELIECSGTIEALPQNIASVSPFIGGFVKQLHYYPGDFVEKGTVLATLIHPDFISLQQRYIEAKNQVDYYKEEYKRQGELTVENAVSIKKMQKAKADYLSNNANYKSLKAHLELMGVNTLLIEKGEFIQEFNLIAPITGTISQLKANKGKYIDTENFVYEIINGSIMNINLYVYEKDISKIKPEQKVDFQILNNKKRFITKVKRAGIKIDKSSRTALVQSTINNKNQILKPGMYINARIFINEKTVYTLPSEALVDFNNKSFVFIKNGDKFIPYKIIKGIGQDNYFEILDANNQLINADIVVKGVYFLMTELETEE